MPPLTPPKSGDALFASVDRVNAELFTLTYGAIVRQLLTDLEEVEEVNKQLDQMGYNIGTRLVDEFLAKSNVSRCVDFKETADVIAKLGFKMFLGVTATVTNWDAEGTSCSFVLEDNPLVDFVELPDTCQGLQYCNVLSGVIPQLLAFPARSSSLKSTQFHVKRNHFSASALRVGTDSVHHGMPTSFSMENSVKGIPPLSVRRNQHPRSVSCQASSLASFSYPELTSKPRWWWRTLACVPYLLPLHNMWSYADVIYQLHTYLQGFSLLYTFIDTMTLCPGWLFLVIFMTVYFFVVRRKWSPHFLRFHVILAILLDTGSQAVATMCTWMPSIVYQGKPMQYFWMSMAFIQIFTVLECMRCALCGMYPNVPFISHTAFIHSDLNLFR